MDQAYARAYQLCQQLGNPPQVFPVLFGLWRFYHVRAAFRTSHELVTQCVTLAQRQHDPAHLLVAHFAMGQTLFWHGEFTSARAHLEQALTHYEPQQHACLIVRYGVNTRVQTLFFTAWTLWMLGYPDQALQRNSEALTCARESAHPLSLAFALSYAACLLRAYRDMQAVHERAEAALTLTTEQAFPHWVAHSTIMQGWAQVAQGYGDAGLVQMCQGLTAYQATGARLLVPYVQALIAEVYGSLRQEAVGLTVLAEAFETVVNTGGRCYEAELYRLKGELLLQLSSDNQPEAEISFQQAISIAQSQHAKSWELRAATSLAKLWQSQGKRREAYDLLAPVYNWFTEGFDTADLKDAKALLDELGA
jgi:predicted ATPase